MSTDSPYKDEIVSCLLNLKETQQPITWENFLKPMQNTTVDTYKDRDMADFKGDWKACFMSVVKMLDMDVKQSRDSWFLVEEGIQTSTKTSSDNPTGALEETQSVLTGISASKSKSSSRQSSTDKNYILTAKEKKCRMMYELLNVSRM
ncbi:uncharacterized protein BX663DRAFT_483091 [Cokeromyces recurvatus]|uniref:uncharacterized protein n=1 Tax=Cokeromyces recurvatus TaxID=90255 RepID=UPI00221E90F3|nr:uncharacterized protein BX663DRAFT_483091 [Cokeromyces recurvatus]KAI7906337.1 hypothetical protein BX663DRAFT_483091 [Cokeromyces recurvatus]